MFVVACDAEAQRICQPEAETKLNADFAFESELDNPPTGHAHLFYVATSVHPDVGIKPLA